MVNLKINGDIAKSKAQNWKSNWRKKMYRRSKDHSV